MKVAASSGGTYPPLPFRPSRLLVVGGRLSNALGLEHDILDNDLGVRVAGQLDPGGATLEGVLGLEEVVDVAGGLNPGLALVDADLEGLGAARGVLDGGSKPVLRGALVHVDGQRGGDGALDELPLDAVDAAGGEAVGQLGPGVGGHVEVVLVAAGFVGDLWSALALIVGRVGSDCRIIP